MIKFCKIFLFISLIFFQFIASAHVQHYDKLNRIEFDIYRNNKNIGKHIFSFNRSGEELNVESIISFQIKKLGLVLYKYKANGIETYSADNLIKFSSETAQNGKKKYVNIKIEDGQYLVDGSSFKGKTSLDHLIGTWWNHSLVKAEAQISGVSGRIIKQKVTFLGEEKITINNKTYNALHFNFSSTDQKLGKDKKLNTDVWYDKENLNWIKASFEKKGKWEYKLISVN